MRLIRILLALVVLGGAGLVGYAYFGDLTPERVTTRVPLELDAQ